MNILLRAMLPCFYASVLEPRRPSDTKACQLLRTEREHAKCDCTAELLLNTSNCTCLYLFYYGGSQLPQRRRYPKTKLEASEPAG